ncbi:hypothetical protein EAH_00068010, partial [Eimeria acervulina]
MRGICVLNTALDLAAAALWTEWGMGEAKWGQYTVMCVTSSDGLLSMGFVSEGAEVVFSGAFEDAMGWSWRGVMKAGYCVL